MKRKSLDKLVEDSLAIYSLFASENLRKTRLQSKEASSC